MENVHIPIHTRTHTEPRMYMKTVGIGIVGRKGTSDTPFYFGFTTIGYLRIHSGCTRRVCVSKDLILLKFFSIVSATELIAGKVYMKSVTLVIIIIFLLRDVSKVWYLCYNLK